MTARPRDDRVAGVSDAAVREKTGRGWREWIATLDRVGGADMAHTTRTRYLSERHGLAGWWSQMVSVGYEQATGARPPYDKPDGFTATASRTIAAPVEMLFDAWHDDARRRRWLGPEEPTITKAIRPKSMRILWIDGTSRVSVNFSSKGAMRSEVAVQHDRLATAEEVGCMKQLWSDALDRLKAELDV